MDFCHVFSTLKIVQTSIYKCSFNSTTMKSHQLTVLARDGDGCVSQDSLSQPPQLIGLTLNMYCSPVVSPGTS